MPLLPDSLRQQLAPVIKHHFWILAALTPLLLVPAVFMSAGQLKTTIDREQATIDGHVSTLNAVRGEPDHPNDAWVKTFDGRTQAVRKEILQEWQGFWESQAPLRSWPDALGTDFLASVRAVESGTRSDLQFRDLQRYQNTVPDLVRLLPQRMGCQELMGDTTDGAEGPIRRLPQRRPIGQGRDGEESPEASAQLSPLEWKAEDQARLFTSFVWAKAPSTTQVLLAQEELWVYGLFCDTINRMNKGAKGAYDASITMVDELAVGYPAAEDKPGGRGSGRILGLQDKASASGVDDGLPPEPTTELGREDGTGPEGRPPHPRFSGTAGAADGFEGRGGFGESSPMSSGEQAPGEDGSGAPAPTPDDLLKQWIYVDFSGKPLTATELTTVPDAQMVHLMPFVLRVTIDQRQIDRLLAELAASPIPIDVRQVRVNPSAQVAGEADFGRQRGMARPSSLGEGRGSAAGEERSRPFDVTLELRGTVGLATQPNPATLGGTEAEADPVAEGGGT